jgi:hypothetical protein
VRALTDLWRRFGETSALAAVASLFALLAVATLALDDAATTGVAVALFAVFVLYCLARPSGRWAVFASATVPGAASTLLHDIAGTPRWIGYALIPLALFMAWDADREARPGAIARRTARPGQ